VIRRPFPVALAAACVALATSVQAAQAISVDCTQAPAGPAGYEIGVVGADRITIPSATPAIAVLDSGVAQVPELQGRLRPGYDVAGGGSNTNDIDGHGTAVAAVAAAAAGGVRGISPTSPIIPIKIFDDAGNSGPDSFVAGIERAVAAHAGVINVSGAGSPTGLPAATRNAVQDAIDAAVSLGVPIIASSGNEGASAIDAPASFAHVIAVGSTDESGAPATYSNRGPGLDLVTPGSNLVTAAPSVLCSSGFATVTGTSFSAPQVAGAAALLLQRHPDLDVDQLADMLRLHAARAAAPLWSDALGFGVLNLPEVLDAPVPTADQPEVNDTIKWAKIQPAALSAPKRSRTLFARISPHQDPSDVYRVKLKKGDKLQVRLQQPSGSSLKLSFGATKLASKSGSSFAQAIKKTGTYYVGVAIKQSPPVGTGYALTLKR
jgi:subtilisin family serine protease